MKLIKLVSKVLVASTILVGGLANATDLTLPGSNQLSTGLPYNDFNVYSLDLLRKCSADPLCQPQSGLPVQSSPGNISDQALVLQSANGQDNFPPFDPGDNIDQPYLSPTGGTASSFDMNSPLTPDLNNFSGAGPNGDTNHRWEMSLSLLQQYLGGHDLVFLFDNNQENNSTDFVFIWGQARIVDINGNTVGGQCWEISTKGDSCLGRTGADPDPNENLADLIHSDYVAVVSDFCVDKLTGVSYKVGLAHIAADCGIEAGHLAGGYQVNNNVSTSVGEFAAFNQALHDAATDVNNGQYFLQLNIKYFANNAGAEQLWICSDCDIDPRREVPEPASLPLVLLGLMFAGISLVRSRRK
jgi:hypothetical protein